MISIYLLSALLLSGAAYAQQAQGLELPDGITLTEENPLAPYARKKWQVQIALQGTLQGDRRLLSVHRPGNYPGESESSQNSR